MRTRWLQAAHRRAEPRPQVGAVAVEFALVLPLLVMLMFGIFTSGMAYSDHLSVTNSVREAARLGSAIDYTKGATAWADAVQARVHQVYFNAGGTLQTSEVCVQLVDSSQAVLASPSAQGSACGSAPAAPAMASGSCVVKVWVKKPAKISLLVFPALTFDIGARSVSYYGRTAGACMSA